MLPADRTIEKCPWKAVHHILNSINIYPKTHTIRLRFFSFWQQALLQAATVGSEGTSDIYFTSIWFSVGTSWSIKRRQQRENFTKPKWKNYDSTMFFSRITTSRCIAVNWYLRVYWLLPLSIVDSFGKHRRLFFKSPWMLGEVNQLHFQKESFPAFTGLFLAQ